MDLKAGHFEEWFETLAPARKAGFLRMSNVLADNKHQIVALRGVFEIVTSQAIVGRESHVEGRADRSTPHVVAVTWAGALAR